MRNQRLPSIVATAVFTWACSNESPQANSDADHDAARGAASGSSGNSSSGTGGFTSGAGASATAGRSGVPGSGGASGAIGNGGSSGDASNGGAAGVGTGGQGGASGDAGPAAGGAPTYPAPVTQHLSIGVHDPSVIHAGAKYYLFATGGRLGIRASTDLQHWTTSGTIFAAMPSFIATELGQQLTDLWAPDVSFFGGLYHVYYAGSVFGSNHSVIGLATNPTLDPTSANYEWVDQGLVIESNKAGGPSDDWNAIDPSLAMDASGQPWLVFGSFWSGIKLRRIDANTGKLSASDTQLYPLANATEGIEAPSIISHGGYYYLFVSYDACCNGVNSTYRTMVGRASAITGPYTDPSGKSMSQGNALQLLATSGRYIGPGGGTAFTDGDRYYYAYHYYDGQSGGASYLMMRPILWSASASASADAWPVPDAPLWQ